jgi:copper(I)-binding protein
MRLFHRTNVNPAAIAAMLLSVSCLACPSRAAAAQPLTVAKAWVRYLLPTIPAAGYMTIKNNGATDAVLVAAASPACGMLMLHESQDNSGMSMMMDVPKITIPAHGSVTFAPGGYHLMCMSPSMAIGDRVRMTLSFQNGETLSVTAPVYGAQTAP